jgi:guanylate kinase
MIMELTVEGGMAVAREYPQTLLIFLFTDEKTRMNRIGHRAQNKHEVELRMQEAKEEEKLAKRHYDFLVENIEDHPEEAIETVKEIIFERFPTLRP